MLGESNWSMEVPVIFTNPLLIKAAVVAGTGFAVGFYLWGVEKAKADTAQIDTQVDHLATSKMVSAARFRDKAQDDKIVIFEDDPGGGVKYIYSRLTALAEKDLQKASRLGTQDAIELVKAYKELEWLLIWMTRQGYVFVNVWANTTLDSKFCVPMEVWKKFDDALLALALAPGLPLHSKAISKEVQDSFALRAHEMRVFTRALFDYMVDQSRDAREALIAHGRFRNPLIEACKTPLDSLGDGLCLFVRALIEPNVKMLTDLSVQTISAETWTLLREICTNKHDDKVQRRLFDLMYEEYDALEEFNSTEAVKMKEVLQFAKLAAEAFLSGDVQKTVQVIESAGVHKQQVQHLLTVAGAQLT